jgi:hypothetical protein
LVLNFHFRGPKIKRVPDWMRKYIIGHMGSIFCFSSERRFYNKEFETMIVKQIKKYCTCCGKEKLENGDANQNSIENEKLISLNMNSEEKTEKSVLLIKNNNSSNLVTFEETKKLYDQLEALIIKLQSSFEPHKLKDVNLKRLLLREIIECEQNLIMLTNFLQNKKFRMMSIKQNEKAMKKLNDEWKIVAVIIDRVCFFVYLFFLLLSTVVFILSQTVFSKMIEKADKKN